MTYHQQRPFTYFMENHFFMSTFHRERVALRSAGNGDASPGSVYESIHLTKLKAAGCSLSVPGTPFSASRAISYSLLLGRSGLAVFLRMLSPNSAVSGRIVDNVPNSTPPGTAPLEASLQ